MAKFEFTSIAEIMAFVGCLTAKAKKEGKGSGDDEAGDTTQQGATGSAPAPMMPPVTGPGTGPAAMTGTAMAGFPGGGAAPGAGAAMGGGFPAAGAPVVDPAIAALVQRISARIDTGIQQGQPADQMLTWFRGELGKAGIAEAANATLDNIKTALLGRLSAPVLDQIAKFINA